MNTPVTTLNQYQEAALRTAPNADRGHDMLHAVYGIFSEAGELADAMKKNHAYGKSIDLVNMREELGDILWYLPLMCRALGTTMEEVANININKLRVRYPEKFTQERALNRNLAAERREMEGPNA